MSAKALRSCLSPVTSTSPTSWKVAQSSLRLSFTHSSSSRISCAMIFGEKFGCGPPSQLTTPMLLCEPAGVLPAAW